jgi:hypothetical protein
VRDADNLFRLAIHPTSHRDGGRRFESTKLLHFVQLDDQITFETSLAWEWFVPTEEMLHEYGCRNALDRNRAKKEKLGSLKPRDRSTYWGSYHLKAYSIRSLVGAEKLDELANVDIIQETENGELAHVSFTFSLKPDWTGDPENARTAVIDRLWRSTRGPLIHVCPYDNDLNPHPSTNIEGVEAPLGPYHDDRSTLRKCLMVLWFRVVAAVWRTMNYL